MFAIYPCPSFELKQRISAEAYQALRDAIAVIFWSKRRFETYIRTALAPTQSYSRASPFPSQSGWSPISWWIASYSTRTATRR